MKPTKRILSVVLAVAMLLGCFTLPAAGDSDVRRHILAGGLYRTGEEHEPVVVFYRLEFMELCRRGESGEPAEGARLHDCRRRGRCVWQGAV